MLDNKKICLLLTINKFDENVYMNTIRSIKNIIDYYIINVNNNIEYKNIKEFFDKMMVNGVININGIINSKEIDYNNFDYILEMESNEEIDINMKGIKLNEDAYMIQIRENEYDNFYKRLYKKFNKNIDYEKIKKMDNIILSVVSKSSNIRIKKNILKIENEILDNPSDTLQYYKLGMLYKSIYNLEKAIENFEICFQHNGIELSKYQIALCKKMLGDKIENFIGDFLMAYSKNQERLEIVYSIINIMCINGLYNIAWDMFKDININYTIPNVGIDIEYNIYNYKFLNELALLSYYMKDYKFAEKIYDKILLDKKYPKSEENNINKKYLSIKNRNININENLEDIFNKIIKENRWGYTNQKFNISTGHGNTEFASIKIREIIKTIILNNDIYSVLDVGCGIWEFDHTEYDGTMYIGLDCVKSVIDFNKDLWKKNNHHFVYADILNEDNNVPEVDLCIIKDVLQHLSNNNIIKMIDKVLLNVKYLLLIQDNIYNASIIDINDGEWRGLSKDKYPLNKYEIRYLETDGVKDILLLGLNKNKLKYEGKIDKNINVEIEKIKNNNLIIENDKNISSIEIADKEMLNKINNKKILLSILARNKGHVLKKYLKCIENLNYDKKLITVYINTNNNVDDTEEILMKWKTKHESDYQMIEYESHNMKELNTLEVNPHDWNQERFKKLGEIRNKSMLKTKEYKCDYYFVVDCDNFIIPDTLKDLIDQDKEIVGPLLKPIPENNDGYSNFFCDITDNGYYKDNKEYHEILNQKKKGIYKVPVIHCTYLIKVEYIDLLNYIDNTNDYEFIIFSRIARKNNIGQYILNIKEYGKCVHFFNEKISLNDEKKKIDVYFKNRI